MAPLWPCGAVLALGMDPGHGPGSVPTPPEFLPAPVRYGSISSELRLADLKLQSKIDSEVFISVPLHSNGEARRGEARSGEARPGQLSSDV